MTLRPLYQPQFMQMAWLLWLAPQLAHFETRAASSAWCDRLLFLCERVARIRFTMKNSMTYGRIDFKPSRLNCRPRIARLRMTYIAQSEL